MTVWNALLDAPGRPASVTWSALVSAGVGGATLVGASIIVTALLTSQGGWWSAVVALVALVQVGAGVLLVTGGVRLATGVSRRELFAGVVLLFLTCGAYALYAVTAVAGNPQDGPGVAALFLAVDGGFALASAVVLYLGLRPTAREFVSGS